MRLLPALLVLAEKWYNGIFHASHLTLLSYLGASTDDSLPIPPPPFPLLLPTLAPAPFPLHVPQHPSCDVQGAEQTAVTFLNASSCSSQACSCHQLQGSQHYKRSRKAKAEGAKLVAQRANLSRQRLGVLAENAPVMSISELYM